MGNENTISADMMKDTIEAAEKKEKSSTEKKSTAPVERKTREEKILVIGTGDGGANISSMAHGMFGVNTIVYNTSARSIENLKYTTAIIPAEEDGSGKNRQLSKDIFKQGPHKEILKATKDIISKENFDYIFVIGTSGGGTGSGTSPNIGKFIADNVSVPVIMVGIYPRKTDDAKVQFNMLQWQSDVEKTNLPYFIVDNAHYSASSEREIHSLANNDVMEIFKLYTGKAYGNTNIQAIDSRDLYMITTSNPGRIFLETSNERIKSNISLDDYLINMIEKAPQPQILNPKVYGLFIKGPKEVLDSIDTSLVNLRSKYGDAIIYKHIEESDTFSVTLMASGCSPAYERIMVAKKIYEDFMASTSKVVEIDYTNGLVDPLSGQKARKLESDKIVTSALDL